MFLNRTGYPDHRSDSEAPLEYCRQWLPVTAQEQLTRIGINTVGELLTADQLLQPSWTDIARLPGMAEYNPILKVYLGLQRKWERLV
jgi:hypothetical protein